MSTGGGWGGVEPRPLRSLRSLRSLIRLLSWIDAELRLQRFTQRFYVDEGKHQNDLMELPRPAERSHGVAGSAHRHADLRATTPNGPPNPAATAATEGAE